MIEGVGEEFIWLLLTVVGGVTVIYYFFNSSEPQRAPSQSNEQQNTSPTIPTTSARAESRTNNTISSEESSNNISYEQQRPNEPPSSHGTTITLRIKLGEQTKSCEVDMENTTVAQLKQNVFGEDIRQGKQVRLIFRGRLLDDAHALAIYELTEESTIHAVITQQQQNQNNAGRQGNGSTFEINLSIEGPWLLYFLLGVMLGVLWYLYIINEQLFDFFSLAALMAFTALWGFFLYQSSVQ